MKDKINFSKDELERMLNGETIKTIKANGEELFFGLYEEGF